MRKQLILLTIIASMSTAATTGPTNSWALIDVTTTRNIGRRIPSTPCTATPPSRPPLTAFKKTITKSSETTKATSSAASLLLGKNIPRGGGTFHFVNRVSDASSLQFFENVCGSMISFCLILYGIACGIDPRGTAKLLYGHGNNNDDKKPTTNKKEMQFGRRNKLTIQEEETNDADTVKFLMRLISYLSLGMGLTSAFAVASEIKNGIGQMAPQDKLLEAIGIGMIPRAYLALTIVTAPIISKPFSKKLLDRINLGPFNGRGGFLFNLIMTTILICSTFQVHLLPSFLRKEVDDLIWGEIVFDAISGLVLFLFPKLMFRPSVQDELTTHECLLTKFIGVYLLMYAPLLLALQLRYINAFPAIGLASLSFVIFQSILQFVTKDIQSINQNKKASSYYSSIFAIVVAFLVSIGTLWNYVTFS